MTWQPQPGPQSLAVAAQFVPELMFGGARGGGKSDYLLGDFAQDVDIGPSWRGILFRKSYAELEELIIRALEIYTKMGAHYKVAASTFVFPTGATLKMRYIEQERDAAKYQGHQYTWVGWDELTNWPNQNAYDKLKACVRSAAGVRFKRIRSSANPGGVGHHWVKKYFVDPNPLGMELIDNKRMFIPSKLVDNKILMENDPEYINTLRELGSEELVRAWLDGDWSVITGAFFPEFSTAKHVIEPFAIPAHWMRFRACDWGSAKPFSVGWYAVSDGYETPYGKWIPDGALVKYREWYGAAGPDKGLRLTGNQVARGIKEREALDRITYGVIDPSAYKQDGGPSIAERMAQEKVLFKRADNQRKAGWDQLRDRLVGDGDSGPMLYFFKTCRDSIRTIPALQFAENDAEDVDTDGEDHAGDETRYACMSRPFRRRKAVAPAPAKLLSTATYDDLWQADVEAVRRYSQV
jgi:hypothetical protein